MSTHPLLRFRPQCCNKHAPLSHGSCRRKEGGGSHAVGVVLRFGGTNQNSECCWTHSPAVLCRMFRDTVHASAQWRSLDSSDTHCSNFVALFMSRWDIAYDAVHLAALVLAHCILHILRFSVPGHLIRAAWLPCCHPVASLSPPCPFLGTFGPLSLPCCLPVASLWLSCRSPVAFLSLPCHCPAALLSLSCRMLLLPVVFFRHGTFCLAPWCCSPVALLSFHSVTPPSLFPVASLSSPCRLSAVLLLLHCRLPVASLSLSCSPTWYPFALSSRACRLPVACLSPSCRLLVTSLSPPCRGKCYPITALLHSCGLPVPFLSAACRLPVVSLSLCCRVRLAFLALFGPRNLVTVDIFPLHFTFLWLSSISIIAVSLLDLPFIYANGMILLLKAIHRRKPQSP